MFVEKRGITDETVPSIASKALLQTGLESDYDSNIFFTYSDFADSNKGKTVTIKLKYSDFKQQTRSKTVNEYLQAKEDFFPIIQDLLYQKEITKSVRLLGISITNLYNNNILDKKNLNMQLKFNF